MIFEGLSVSDKKMHQGMCFPLSRCRVGASFVNISVVNLKPFPSSCISVLLGAVLKFKDFPVQMNWVVSSGLLWNRRCTLFAGVPGSQPVYVISFGQKIIWICIMMVYFSLEVTVRRLQLCAYLSMEFKLWKKSKLLGKRVTGVKTRRAVGRLV